MFGGKMKPELELVTINIMVPGITDEVVLEVIAAGISELISQHKELGLSFTDTQMQEWTRLTIGDHICELVGQDDKLFSYVYDSAIDQIDVILASMWSQLEEFTTQVDAIHDIHRFWYPGLIRLGVVEKPIHANKYSELYVS